MGACASATSWTWDEVLNPKCFLLWPVSQKAEEHEPAIGEGLSGDSWKEFKCEGQTCIYLIRSHGSSRLATLAEEF